VDTHERQGAIPAILYQANLGERRGYWAVTSPSPMLLPAHGFRSLSAPHCASLPTFRSNPIVLHKRLTSKMVAGAPVASIQGEHSIS
jgi:hypothetical protein